MKQVFIDVGELGWSLYLSAHMRWLKHTSQTIPSVMILPGREVFYSGLVDEVFYVPGDFSKTFDLEQQDRFGFLGVDQQLRDYVNSKLPKGYEVSERQPLGCPSWKTVFLGQMMWEPYQLTVRHAYCFQTEIYIFPRQRKAEYFNKRNLPRAFYVALITRLCDEFHNYTIRSIGTKNGTYEITEAEIGKENYSNFFDITNIQDLINFSQFAIGAVGSQSFPLKLSLLQGVPSFIIGHEKHRHTVVENWMKTRTGFYEIDKDGYNNFHSEDCINKIVEFLKEGKDG